MKTYTKIHQNKKAAETHLKKIKQRGGIAEIKPVKGGTRIDYYFPEKKTSTNKKYDVISPDGFSIRIGVPPFSSIKERDKYFKMWKERFAKQGYYSSVKYGRIHLADLADYCEWIEV
jgi:hypothetical protein